MYLKESEIQIEIMSVLEDQNIKLCYPGFCTIRGIQNEKIKETPKFISGVGRVINKSEAVEGLYKNDYVAFSGYCQDEVNDSLVAMSSSVIKLNDINYIENFSLIGIVSTMINAIKELSPKLGEKVLLIAEGKYKKLLMQLISYYGCVPVDNNSLDVNIYLDSCIVMEKLTKVQITQIRNNLHTESKVCFITNDNSDIEYLSRNIVISNSLGQGFFDQDYMMNIINYPEGYVLQTVHSNLKLAVEFINKNFDYIQSLIIVESIVNKEKNKEENDTNNFLIFIKETKNFSETDNSNLKIKGKLILEEKTVNEMAKISERKINPFIIQLTTKYNENSLNNVNYTIEYITGNNIVECKFICDNNVVQIIRLRFNDGSVGNVHLLKVPECKINIEMHFDGTTLIYKDRTMQVY